jgi:hypothetical protein
MDYKIIREPVILHRPAIYLKATFVGSLTVAEEISNRIGVDFNIDAAIEEAERLIVLPEFKEARHICNEIEKDIQRRHRLHWPLFPPIASVVNGDHYLVKSIEYIPHNESGVMIALLKIELV